MTDKIFINVPAADSGDHEALTETHASRQGLTTIRAQPGAN